MGVGRSIWNLVAAAVSLQLVSCAVTPAKLVKRSPIEFSTASQQNGSLHALLEVALENPNVGQSAGALGDFVGLWRTEKGTQSSGKIEGAPGSEGDLYVQFSAGEGSGYLPGYFDEIRSAGHYRVKRMESHTRDGIGAPLIAVRENRGSEPIERFYPPEAISREVTAIIRSDRRRGGERHVVIELIDSLAHESVVIGRTRQPLAADFSACYAALLERCKELSRSELADLLNPVPRREPQLYLTEPYDREKEPLLMIHGLADSPLTWAEMTNELRSDPAIRKRYQVWQYLYNTSAPALYSGRILRSQLAELRALVDPDRDDPATNKLTVVSHSMGGLVTRSLITSPGQAFWEAAFTRPISSLDLSSADREELRDAFFWRADASVHRVVFICTPHRGARFADNPIGRLARKLVKPPSKFREFYERVSVSNPGVFTQAYEELGRGELDSVGSLSPKQPTLQILADLPLGYPVEMHSVIGNRGLPGDLEKSTDGVVPYSSSHLADVESEIILPVGHRCLDKEKTIAAVHEILLQP